MVRVDMINQPQCGEEDRRVLDFLAIEFKPRGIRNGLAHAIASPILRQPLRQKHAPDAYTHENHYPTRNLDRCQSVTAPSCDSRPPSG